MADVERTGKSFPEVCSLDITLSEYWGDGGVPVNIALVPIDRTAIRCRSNEKCLKYMEMIKKSGSVPPIICSWWPSLGVWLITDGRHRVNACKRLGYTHMPAIVNEGSEFEVVVPWKDLKERLPPPKSSPLTDCEWQRQKVALTAKMLKYTKDLFEGRKPAIEGVEVCRECKTILSNTYRKYCHNCDQSVEATYSLW
jgi:hypothetical protein